LGDATVLSRAYLWPIRVFAEMQAEMGYLGVALVHDQVRALQSYGTNQCALAMLFDQHVQIPDALRQTVCDVFCQHPDPIPYKGGKCVYDRTGNNTLLHCYEAWLFENYRGRPNAGLAPGEFAQGRGPVVDGVCDVCDQFDSPDQLVLCENDMCPSAMHTFCGKLPDEWLCEYCLNDK